MQVALFATCLVDARIPAAGRATVALLKRHGRTGVGPTAPEGLRELGLPEQAPASSATSGIGPERVGGAHRPRQLAVTVVTDQQREG